MQATQGLWNKVATHCCVCGLTLVDALSCEKGIGPVCRKKYEYEDAFPITPEVGTPAQKYLAENFPVEMAERVAEALDADDSRKAANLLVYFASAELREEDGDYSVHAAHVLGLIGYGKLSERILDRLVQVRLTRTPAGKIAVKTPYKAEFVAVLKAKYVAGREWDRENKVWLMPDSPEGFEALSNALKVFKGLNGVGPNGAFTV